MLFDHGFELEIHKHEPCFICMTLYMASFAHQTDHFANAIIHENAAYGYVVVTML